MLSHEKKVGGRSVERYGVCFGVCRHLPEVVGKGGEGKVVGEEEQKEALRPFRSRRPLLVGVLFRRRGLSHHQQAGFFSPVVIAGSGRIS